MVSYVFVNLLFSMIYNGEPYLVYHVLTMSFTMVKHILVDHVSPWSTIFNQGLDLDVKTEYIASH